jgi:simple sugar transport system ATP-binding protein
MPGLEHNGRMANPPALTLRHVTKRFGPLVANDDISLELQRGEVLALLGENGAGKSTLVAILFGHYVADAGSIEVDGHPLPPGDTGAALAAGIGMVHQHFTLAENLSVLDNVMLGTEPLWQPFSRRSAAREQLRATGERFGLAVDAEARVADLSVGERQRVEILKALVRGARVLILDEPTAVLTPAESQRLFATLRKLVDGGLSVIFISHKLDEVLAVSQRIAVLRAGRLVATLAAAQAGKAELAALMVGRDVAPPRRSATAAGAARCVLRGVSLRGAHVRDRLEPLELELRGGEIVAVAGVSGNGQHALAMLLFGLRAPDTGTVELDGVVMPADPRAWVRAGVARIPEDRQAEGTVGDMAIWENAVLERPQSFARAGLLQGAAAIAHARRIVERYDVRGAGTAGRAEVAAPVRSLSGGNMQKLILGRVLGASDEAATPALVVAEQPTWGLDVGAVAFVHQQLIDAAARGSAVLLISEDLDEIFAIADRIAVMHRGRLGDARPVHDWTLEAVGLAMAGPQGAADAA